MGEDASQNGGEQRGRLARGIGAALLAVWAIGSVAGLIEHDRSLHWVNLHPWSEHDSRFARKGQRYLPLVEPLRGEKIVGFVSSYHREEGQRMMAQSMLAPTLVIDSDEPAVLIASFKDERELERFLATSPFAVRQRFGGGVAIVGRR